MTITDLGGGVHQFTAAAGGITSINSDITTAQQIVGSGTITVSTSYGITTIGGGGAAGSASRDTSILVNTVPYSDDYFVSINVTRPIMINGV
jgi:hypothetical protein